jgi:hypothetical protein
MAYRVAFEIRRKQSGEVGRHGYSGLLVLEESKATCLFPI